MGRYVLTPIAAHIEDLPGISMKVEDLADEILADAQRLCPVDTGHLRASGYATKDRVGFTADYAGYVEFGTSHMNAQPFLTPAALKYRGVI